jgi:hypothetical protein
VDEMIEITDKYVLKTLREVNSPLVNSNIFSLEEYDRDEKSDLLILVEELDYALDLYNTEGTMSNDHLKLAQNIYDRTNGFTTMPVDPNTFQAVYTKAQLSAAEMVLQEVQRINDALRKARKRWDKTEGAN